MIYFLILILAADPISITVIKGSVETKSGEVKIGAGTFIPSPEDKKLAKEIVDKNSKIKKLEIKIEAWEKKFLKLDEYWSSRENKMLDFYQSENVRMKREISRRDNWWNAWGKVVVTSLASAAVAAFITYEVVKK